MKKYLLLACLFALFLFGPSMVFSYIEKNTQKPSSVASKPLNAETLWSLIQTWRQSDDCRPGGCQPYIKDQRLCEIAERRIEDLKGKILQNFNHNLFVERYKNYPYKLSENITGASSSDDALSRWLNSQPHTETLKRDIKYSCIATGSDYAVQIFSNME